MKLELRDLAPYLPYGVKMIFEKSGDIRVLNGLFIELGELRFHFNVINRGQTIWNYKPILRPLSDLNRFGEDIINEHSINLLISEKYNLEYGTLSHFKGELSIDLDGDFDLRYDANKNISFDVMLTIQKELLKGHYDIFNLIENNLAIDINTIK